MNQHEMQEWSEGGRELLAIFNGLINNYGGAEKLANDIECEAAKSFIDGKNVYWTQAEVRYLRRNYMRMSYREVGKKVGKSEQAIHHKLAVLYDGGLKRKGHGVVVMGRN